MVIGTLQYDESQTQNEVFIRLNWKQYIGNCIWINNIKDFLETKMCYHSQ